MLFTKENEMQPRNEQKIDWICSSKSFKPLFDLLEHSDQINEEFYKNVKKRSLQNFVMSPEIAYEAQKIANDIAKNTEQNSLLFNKVMLPYDEVLVEMPLTEEVKKIRAPMLKETQTEIQRIGAYIKTKIVNDKLCFIFSPYWGFVNGKNCHALVEIDVYFENNKTVISSRFINEYKKLANSQNLANIYTSKFLFDGLELLTKEAADEIGVLLVAWCILVNSKSGIEKTNIAEIKSNSKLGKRERKRRSRSAYTIVSLQELEKINYETNTVQKLEIAAHRVRGHFKVRKNGIFWWRPFVRGIGELIERQGYKLTA
jgi:hypothetical protein